MVTITNGIKTFRVTSGAVSVYKSLGFHTVTDEELEEMQQATHEHFNDTGEPEISAKRGKEESDSDEEGKEQEDTDSGMNKEDAAFIEEILEKPLSQWTNDEVKEFVRIKEIDTSGAQKVSQVRGIIKNYLEEQNKNA